MQQQVAQLVQAAMQGDPKANQTIQQIQKAAQGGDQQAAQILQLIQQVAQQLTRRAAKGAKLEYIKSLKGICNSDEELVYLKKGGKVCPICQKKKVEKEKCGGAVKAFKKKMQGGGQAPQKKTTPTTYDEAKHKALQDRFRKSPKDANNNPKNMSPAQVDSLQAYNRMKPAGDWNTRTNGNIRYGNKKK